MIGLLKSLLMSVSLSWSAIVNPSGPLVVRNGAGLSEFYLVYAQNQHQALIQLCLAQENCAAGLDSSLRDLLRVQISAELKLVFLTSQEMGSQRVIAVSSTEIRLNKDLLFNDTATGPEAWKYADAIRFFVHLRATSLHWDKKLEASVTERLVDFSDVVQERSMHKTFHNLSLVLFPEAPSLVIEDSSAQVTATSFEIPLANLDCQSSSQSAAKISRLKIRSAAWTGSDPRDTVSTTLGLSGIIDYQCPTRGGAQQAFRSRYQIFIRAEQNKGDWNAKQDSLQVYQTEIEAVIR